MTVGELASLANFSFGSISAAIDGNGNLTITDTDGTGKNNSLTISNDGAGNIVITDAAEQFSGTGGVAGAVISNENTTLTIPLASITGTKIIVNGVGGNDTLTVNLANALGKNLDYSGGVGGNDALTVTGYSLTTADGVADVSVIHTGNDSGTIVLAGLGTITFDEIEPLTLGGTAADLEITLPAGADSITLGDDGGAQDTNGNTANTSALYDASSPYSFEFTEFTNPSNSLWIKRGSAADDLYVLDLVASGLNASLKIGDAGSEFDQVTFRGPVTLAANKSLTVNALGTIGLTSTPSTTSNLAASGTGAISLTTARDVVVVDGSSITTVDGGVTLEANQQAVPTSGDFVGVNVDYARIETSGSGAVTVRGRGGDAETGNQFGVRVTGSKILGGTTLPLTVVGTGGASAGINNLGVVVTGAQSQISSAGGDVTVTGTGGGVGNSIFNYGVRVAAAAELTAGGSGTVTVIGHGGNSEGTGDGNYGVSIGVNNARISSGGGSISVTGTAGSGSTRFGIALMSNGQIVATTGTPTVTLVADRMDLETSSSLIDAGGNTVLLRQLTEGRAINLGGDDSGQLGLTDAELNRIHAGVLQIGDSNSGTITVSADMTRAAATNMELHTGGDIVLGGGQIDTGGGTLLLDSGASPAAVKPTKTGTDVTASTLSFGSDLAIVIDGITADTQYTQLNVAGIVNLTGVDLKISGTYTPSPTDSFVIVANDSSDAVVGTFTGLAEGSVVNVLGRWRQITYAGGTGNNDVVLRANTPPVAVAGGPYVGVEGAQFSLDASGSSDAEQTASSLTYEWDLNYDGATFDANVSGSHPAVTFPDDVPEHTIALRVTDAEGSSQIATTTLTIINNDPTITMGPNVTIDEGLLLAFSAGVFDSGSGDTHTYLWDFGDGQTASGTLTPSHAYADNGDYTVRLTVTDDDGGTSSATVVVTVQNVAPTITMGPDVTIDEGSMLALSASVFDPGGGDTHTYLWDFGDGQTASGTLTPSHAYVDNGDYTVRLTVTDDDGGASSATLLVTVRNVAPTVTMGPDMTVEEGSMFTLSASVFDPGSGDTHTYLWDFGDGHTASGTLTPSHAYADNGDYTVRLTVTDDDGGQDEVEITITVDNVAPIPSIVSVLPAREGMNTIVSSVVEPAGANDTLTYTWDFGNGDVVSGVGLSQIERFFEGDGSYSVTLTVADEDGGSNHVTHTWNIANTPPSIALSGDATVNENAVYSLTLGSILDPGNDTVTQWRINWGDGSAVESFPSGGIKTHTYPDGPTNPTIRVALVDEDGTHEDAGTLTLTVNNVLPVASISGPATGDVASGLDFVLAATDLSPDDQSAGFVFDINWGDGVTETVNGTSGLGKRHVFTDFGNYTIQVTATDKDGGVSSSASLQVSIPNSGVTAIIDADALGSGADNQINVSRSGDNIIITLDGVIVLSTPISSLSNGLVINCSSGDDTLTLDFSTGNPLAGLNLTFDGGVGGDDSVNIVGGDFASITQQLINATDGVTVLEFASAEPSVSFNWLGLEPFLLDVGSVGQIIFELPAGVTNAVLEDADLGDTLRPGMMQLRSSSSPVDFETTIFTNPSVSLTIRGGDGTDLITIASLDSSFDAQLVIDHDALGTDAVNVVVDTPISVARGIVIEATSITVNEPITSTGFDIELAASAQLTLNDDVESNGGNVALASSQPVTLAHRVTGTEIRLDRAAFVLTASGVVSGSVTVTNGATLSGNGTVNGEVIVPLTVATITPSLSAGVLPVGTTSLSVTFSQPIVNGTVLGNYELRRTGSGGLLLDSNPATSPSSVVVNGRTATLTFPALVEDVYRLTVKDAITNNFGAALDGDADDVAGGNWRGDFVTVARYIRPVSIADPSPIQTANGESRVATRPQSSVSADGRYTVFTSKATDLLPDQFDNNGRSDVFLYDRVLDTRKLVSHLPGLPSVTGSSSSDSPSISADGRFVVFQSQATNLVAGTDSNGQYSDIFLYDVLAGTVKLVSHLPGAPGTSANSASQAPVISADGKTVAFGSYASNLVSGSDSNSSYDVFVYDAISDTVNLASHIPGIPTTTANFASSLYYGDPSAPSISADGKFVAFISQATNLVSGSDNNGTYHDVFLYDVTTGTVKLVSHLPGAPTTSAYGASYQPTISQDGKLVAFVSSDSNGLVPGTEANGGDDIFLYDAVADTVRLVSHAAGSALTGDSYSRAPSISADGKFIAFQSYATNLVTGNDNNGTTYDAFLYDVQANTITLVSHVPSVLTTSGNGFSDSPAISADGNFIAFRSAAFNLTVDTDNSNYDIFLYARDAGTVTRVSSGLGASSNHHSYAPHISADGRFVAFEGYASNLIPGKDTNNNYDVILGDTTTGTLTLVSTADPSPIQTANDASSVATSPQSSVSADGRYTVFSSTATDLLPDQFDRIGSSDVFLYDRVLDSHRLVSHLPGLPSVTGSSSSDLPSISADGRFVVFQSQATNLVAGTDGNSATDIFLYDVLAGTVKLVSHLPGAPGTAANSASRAPVISADGKTVAFVSYANNLVSGSDSNGAYDVFVYDATSDTVKLVSHVPGTPTTAANGHSSFNPSTGTVFASSISADGKFVAFQSQATNLVGGSDSNGTNFDVFLYDVTTTTVKLVSHLPGVPTTSASGASYNPTLSQDGQFVAFVSSDSNGLVPGTEANGGEDVFLYDAVADTTRLVSHAAGSTLTGNNYSNSPSISADGKFVAFQSYATNLVTGNDSNGTNSDAFLYDVQANTITLASHVPSELTTSGNGFSDSPVISADGDFIAFRSAAFNLTGDTDNSNYDIFLYARVGGTVTRVSSGLGAPSNHHSYTPHISADGRFVAFQSFASNLIPGKDTNISVDVILGDTTTGFLTLVSAANPSPIQTANGASSVATSPQSSVSADGRYTVFTSTASDVLPDQFDNSSSGWDVFLYDRVLNTHKLVSHLPGQPSVTGNSFSASPSISANGRFVAFQSSASNLVTGTDSNNSPDVFLYDVLTGTVKLVSHLPGVPGTSANSSSQAPAISADGNMVAFVSYASNLVSGSDSNNAYDVFVYDAISDTVSLASHIPGTPTTAADYHSSFYASTSTAIAPSISGDGKFVVFQSQATNLVGGNDSNGTYSDVFLYDVTTGAVNLVSHVPGAPTTSASGASYQPTLSHDGRLVAFVSSDSNSLVPDTEANGGADVFLYDAETDTIRLVSHAAESTNTGDGNSSAPSISADGKFVAFQSYATNLVTGSDNNSTNYDAFLYDVQANTITLISHVPGASTTSGNGFSDSPVISADGNFIAFRSAASNLIGDMDNSNYDIFLYARNGGTVTRISSGLGASSNDHSYTPHISADGRFVAFYSYASNLIPGKDTNSSFDVFLFDSTSLKFVSPTGFEFDIASQGFGAGQLIQGTNNAFDGLSRLMLDGVTVAPQGQFEISDFEQTVTTPPQNLAGLNVSREVTVPNTGSQDFARTIDVFHNPSPVGSPPITTTVRVVGNLGSDAATVVFATANGNTDVEVADQWIGTDDGDGTGTPAIIHYIHGPSGLQPTNVQVINDNIFWEYNLTVPAGDTVRLAHFTILGNTRAQAVAAANALVTNAGFDGQAAAFLTVSEVDSITNFEFNEPPIANAGGAYIQFEGTAFSLDASTSSDPNESNSALTFEWDLDYDDVTFNSDVSGQQPTVSFPDNFAARTIAVRVTDSGNLSHIATSQLTVNNVIPQNLTVSGPTVAVEGASVSLTASATDPAGPADPLTYTWSVTRDGTPYHQASGANISFAVPDNGSYVATVTVGDGDDGLAVSSHTVTVTNANPIASIDTVSTPQVEGTAINVTASATDSAGANDTLTYAWSVYKNGSTESFATGGNSTTFMFTPDDNGQYRIVFLVNDDDGGHDEDETTITVGNVAPQNLTVNGPTTAVEGTSVSLTASATDPAGLADPLTFTWSITRDGTLYHQASGANISFAVPDNGSYVATVTVGDGDDGSAVSSHTVTVANADPIASIDTVSTPQVEGTAITVTASATDPAGINDTLTYAWSVYKNGSTESFATGGNSTTFTFTPDDNGQYRIVFLVNDDDGGHDEDETTITVGNVAPQNLTVSGPTEAVEGTSVSLTASATDPAGLADPLTYAWSVTRDGTLYHQASGANISFAVPDNGSYVATVTVGDGDAGSAVSSHTVTVTNANPIATIDTVSTPQVEGTAITVTASATDPAGINDMLTYAWSVYKNGSTALFATGGNSTTLTFTPDDNGQYRIVFRVNDEDGGHDEDETTITVDNVAPQNVTVSGPTTAVEGGSVSLTASATDPAGLADPLTYTWSIARDGAPYHQASGANISFAVPDNGTYVATVTVDDGDDGSAVSSHTVTVANANPIASIDTVSTPQVEGTAISVSASATDPAGAKDTLTYAWSVYKNGSTESFATGGNSTTFMFTPDDNGQYRIVFLVNDEDDGSGIATTTITVANLPPTLTIDRATVIAAVGSQAVITGTFGDVPADTVTLTPTVGEVLRLDGRWVWLLNVNADTPASQIVTITAVDDDGDTTTTTFNLVTFNLPPLVTAVTVNTTGDEGSLFAFHADVLNLAGTGGSLTYHWDFGDGSAAVTGANLEDITHRYYASGVHTLTVTVFDDPEETGTVRRLSVTVNNVAPTVAATNPTVLVNEGSTATNTGVFGDVGNDTVTLRASIGSVVPTGDGTWSWSFDSTDGPDQNATVAITAKDSDNAPRRPRRLHSRSTTSHPPLRQRTPRYWSMKGRRQLTPVCSAT